MKLSLSPMRSHLRIMLSIKRALAVPHQDFDLPGTACRLWYYHCIAMISRHGHIPGVTSSQSKQCDSPGTGAGLRLASEPLEASRLVRA